MMTGKQRSKLAVHFLLFVRNCRKKREMQQIGQWLTRALLDRNVKLGR